MSQGISIRVPVTDLRWFTDSPDTGDPACLCSWCGKPIARGTPIRLYWERSATDVLECRLHDECCEPVLGMKVHSFDDDEWPDDGREWGP